MEDRGGGGGSGGTDHGPRQERPSCSNYGANKDRATLPVHVSFHVSGVVTFHFLPS